MLPHCLPPTVKGNTQLWPLVVGQVWVWLPPLVAWQGAGYTWHVAPYTRPRTWKSGQQVLSVLPTLWQWWKVLSGSQVRLIACSWS